MSNILFIFVNKLMQIEIASRTGKERGHNENELSII